MEVSELALLCLNSPTHPPYFAGRGLTIVGSILEGDFNERADDVALAKEVRANQYLGQKHFMLQFSDFP